MRKAMNKEVLLKVEKLVKTFPGTIALDEVDFTLHRGEVHAIVGENGAGKSTLMKILSGIYVKDSGTITIEGEENEIGSVGIAQQLGISMIYQELENIQKLSVAENIYLGKLPKSSVPGFVNFKKLIHDTKTVLQEFDIAIDPTVKLSRISTAEQQFVEIIKAITTKNAKIVIMDEPTSSLTKKEVDKLFAIIKQLREKQISVIYISHRLDEVTTIADRISVFRDGKNRGVLEREQFAPSTIISMMIGHDLKDVSKRKIERDEVIFEIRDMEIQNKISHFSLTLHKGEILGIAGLMGSGKDELVKSIFGLWPSQKKSLFFHGKPLVIKNPCDAIRNGIVYLPEERKLQSCFLDMSVKNNISPLWLFEVEKQRIIDNKKELELADHYIDALHIKTPSAEVPIIGLSGGNQQKAIFSRMLALKPKMMVLNDPTRGVDIGSKEDIYHIIQTLAQEGVSILLLSSEIPEISRLSDTVIVLSRGEVLTQIQDEDVTTERIVKAATRV